MSVSFDAPGSPARQAPAKSYRGWALIIFTLTLGWCYLFIPYGHALGLTGCAHRPSNSKRPVITLHPSIWGDGTVRVRKSSNAWGGTPSGTGFALDVIIHELLHAYLSARGEETKHDSESWAREVMRVSPILGLGKIVASPTKRERERRSNGTYAMLRVPRKPGSISMRELASWPQSLRRPSYYQQAGTLPFAWHPEGLIGV